MSGRTTILACAIVLVVAAGCGMPGGSSSGSPGSGGSGGGLGAPRNDGGSGGGGGGLGAPRNNGGGAIGAPIRVPAFQVLGAPYSDVEGSIMEAIAEACGGDVCLTPVTRIVPAERGAPCTITKLPPVTDVPRDSELVFEISSACDAPPEPTEDTEPTEESSAGAEG